MNEEETFEETVQNFQQINKIHWNLEQNVIITTEDKLKLCLYKAIDRLDAKRKWWTPSALLVTLVLALTTAEFKEQFSISPATWQAVFLDFDSSLTNLGSCGYMEGAQSRDIR